MNNLEFTSIHITNRWNMKYFYCYNEKAKVEKIKLINAKLQICLDRDNINRTRIIDIWKDSTLFNEPIKSKDLEEICNYESIQDDDSPFHEI